MRLFSAAWLWMLSEAVQLSPSVRKPVCPLGKLSEHSSSHTSFIVLVCQPCLGWLGNKMAWDHKTEKAIEISKHVDQSDLRIEIFLDEQ